MAQNKEKIVVCGHYGSTNIGDEAIGFSLIQNLKKTKPDADITILSYNPDESSETFNINSQYLLPLGIRSLIRGIFKGELRKTLKVIKECDKFILGGGGLFTDEKIFAIFLWGLHAFCALKYKKPLYMIGQSVGPLNSKIGKWITKKCFSKAEMIVVRDNASKKVLEETGIRNEIQIAPDLAFGIKNIHNFPYEESIEKLNKKVEQNDLKGYFVVSIRPWKKNTDKLYNNLEQAIGRIVQEYKLLPVLIPFQLINQNDEQLMHKIVDRNTVKYPFLIQKFTQNIFEVIKIIQGAKFTLGMRLHSLIFSIISNTPFVAISYSPKVRNLINDVGLSEFVINSDEIDQILNKFGDITSKFEFIKQKQEVYTNSSQSVILEIFQKI